MEREQARNGTGTEREDLDQYLPRDIREWIEGTYYARANMLGGVEHFIHDPEFLRDPLNHIAFFADHGVVHVRDIARQILSVLTAANGVLFPLRPRSRLDDFMKGYGVMLAYVHDIGMADFSQFGRTMHPEAATQIVFEPVFDEVIRVMWSENCGHVPRRLAHLASLGVLEVDPQLVLREMLALAVCHSKKKVPVHFLSDPALLRPLLQDVIATDLRVLHARQTGVPSSTGEDSLDRRDDLRRFYADVRHDAFRWLTGTQWELLELVADVMDTVRALRCADALRQRGTTLHTSGNYQLFVDQATAHAVCAIETGGKTFLVSVPDLMAGGEANLAGSELDRQGNLRVSFHHGAFASAEATRRAVASAVLVIHDMQSDVLGTFRREEDEDRQDGAAEADVVLERTDDNPEFVSRVRADLIRLEPALEPQIRIVPSLAGAPEHERVRYMNTRDLRATTSTMQQWLTWVGRTGHKTAHIDVEKAFEHTKLVSVRRGEALVRGGQPAHFVYIPLGPGLRVIPLGGYDPRPLPAWAPVGTTGVIRGAIRNATIVADDDITLLMIPRDTYLQHWYDTYSVEEFIDQFSSRPPDHE